MFNYVISKLASPKLYKKTTSLNRSIMVRNNNFNTKINNFYIRLLHPTLCDKCFQWLNYGRSVVFVGYWGFFPIKLIATISLTYCFEVALNTIALTQSCNVLYAGNTWGKKQNGILCDEWIVWRNVFNVLTYIKIRIRYII